MTNIASETYEHLARAIRQGQRPTLSEIDRVLGRAQKTYRDLVADAMAGLGTGPSPGDPCPECEGGQLRVYSSSRRGAVIAQYMECAMCRYKPPRNKRVLAGWAVSSRARKKTVLPK